MPTILINAAAGAGRVARVASEFATTSGASVEVPSTAENLRALARAAAAGGEDRVVVVGGDGTLHQVARELAGTRCALGIVPAGTGNDLARALGIDRDPRVAMRRALEGSPRRIDVGSFAATPFLGVATAGFTGAVLEWIARRGHKRMGPAIYGWAVVRTLTAFVPPRCRVEHDAGAFDGRVTLVAVANSPCFGGGMRIAPAARLDDGWLDLVLVDALPRLRLLAALPRLYAGTHVHLPGVHSVSVRRATLVTEPPLEVYGDGEPMGRADGQATTVAAGALAVIV